MKKILQWIFSIKNEGANRQAEHKVLTVFGIKFKFLSLRKILNQIVNQTKDYPSQNKTKRIYRLYPLEEYFPKNFYKDFITSDLTEKYRKLVYGLDKESINTVARVISRIQRFAKYGQIDFEVSEREYNNIEKIRLIYSNPIRLANDIDGFGEYIIPVNVFCATALYYDCFMDYIKDKEKILNNDIIDAGAYVGDSALVLSKYTNKKIHSFEPLQTNYDRMLKTIKINDLENIVPVKLGLGAKADNAIINSVKDVECMASFSKDYIGSETENVSITTIDDYVKENNIKIGLIKTDVEGFEQNLLMGAIETIKRDKPVLSISIYHTFDDFFNIKPWIENLNLGYKFKIIKPDVEDICCDVTLIAEVSVQ